MLCAGLKEEFFSGSIFLFSSWKINFWRVIRRQARARVYNLIYLCPGLLQSDEFWLLESSSSSRDVPIDDIAADTTVSVGLRGSLPADTLLFIAVVVVDVAKILVQVVDAINFCGSIGSIWNEKERRKPKAAK